MSIKYKYTLMLLLLPIFSSCGYMTTLPMEKYINKPENTIFITKIDTVVYECRTFTSGFNAWFGFGMQKCLMPIPEDLNRYKILHNLKKGTKIKFIRLLHPVLLVRDTCYFESEIPILNDDEFVYIYPRDAKNMFGIKDISSLPGCSP